MGRPDGARADIADLSTANVFLPKDRISLAHQGFGFCEFLSEEDADYAVKIMNQIKLFGKPIRVNKASYDKKQLDVGANLFIGNVDSNVDEQALYDTFSVFGAIADQPKVRLRGVGCQLTVLQIARDPASGDSKGYGFISFHDFESADQAIENMNNQFLGGKQVTVQYAFKKDGKGERHGTQAERLLAAQAKKHSMGGAFGMGAAPAYIPPAVPASAPAPVAATPPALPAGFAPSNVIGAPAAQGGYPQQYPPAPPAGYPQYGQGYEGYDAYAQQGYTNGYAGQQQHQQHQQHQQQYGSAPPPPPPIRMGFNQ